MTTPQDINAALDAFKMINRGPAESPNENEIMFNGFLFEKEVRIIEQILQSHAPEASPVDADSVLADFYRTSDLKGVTIGEDTVLRVFYRYLLRRGFFVDRVSPVDVDQLKRPVEFNRQGNQIINLYNDGYNDAIDELLRRGFRQGGGWK